MLGKPRDPAQQRHEQDVGVRQARRRVAGHAEHRLAADAAERRRLARLDGDAVEDHLAALPQARRGPDRARRRSCRPRRRATSASAAASTAAASASSVSAAVRSGIGNAAVLANDRRQREAVDVVDLARAERLARARRSRCRSRGSRLAGCAKTSTSATPIAASAPTRLGFSSSPVAEDRLAGGDVGGAAPDVLPRIDRRHDADAFARPPARSPRPSRPRRRRPASARPSRSPCTRRAATGREAISPV